MGLGDDGPITEFMSSSLAGVDSVDRFELYVQETGRPGF